MPEITRVHLTGDLFDGLTSSAQADKDNLGGSIGYSPADAGKVLGAEARGRNILGVSKENADWIFKRILSQVDENIRKDFAKTITINVG